MPVSQGEAPSSSEPPWVGECLPFLASARGYIAVFSNGVLACELHGSAPEGTLLFCLGAAQWEMPQVQLPHSAVRQHCDSTAMDWRRRRNLLPLVQGCQ